MNKNISNEFLLGLLVIGFIFSSLLSKLYENTKIMMMYVDMTSILVFSIGMAITIAIIEIITEVQQ